MILDDGSQRESYVIGRQIVCYALFFTIRAIWSFISKAFNEIIFIQFFFFFSMIFLSNFS